MFTLDFFVTSTTDDGIIQNSKANQICAGANTTKAVMQTNKISYVGQGTFIAKAGCWINYYIDEFEIDPSIFGEAKPKPKCHGPHETLFRLSIFRLKFLEIGLGLWLENSVFICAQTQAWTLPHINRARVGLGS